MAPLRRHQQAAPALRDPQPGAGTHAAVQQPAADGHQPVPLRAGAPGAGAIEGREEGADRVPQPVPLPVVGLDRAVQDNRVGRPGRSALS